MENNGNFYYLELLFNDGKKRDQAYGKELLYDITQLDITLNSLKPYEVLYKQKGTHITGRKKWGVAEKLPTIEMLIALHEEEDLDYLTLQTNFRVGALKHVNQGTLLVETNSLSSKDEFKAFNSELNLLCESNNLNAKSFQIISEGLKGVALNFQYHSSGCVTGSVRKVLYIYEFIKNRINCKNLRLVFQ